MSTSEKFSLKWIDFQENMSSAFGSLREEPDFADVTLACEDGFQIKAHKVIIAASSPVLQNILKNNKHPHPLIYMRGMKSSDLLAIVDFIYHGEAMICQQNLESFLVIAEELKMNGLAGETQQNKIDDDSKTFHKSVVKNESPQDYIQTDQEDHISGGKSSTISETNIILNDCKVSTDIQELDDKINSMMRPNGEMLTGSYTGKRALECTVCGKVGPSSHIRAHIEANHTTGFLHPCNFCDKYFRYEYLNTNYFA